jgi:hypothetical protein
MPIETCIIVCWVTLSFLCNYLQVEELETISKAEMANAVTMICVDSILSLSFVLILICATIK